MAKRDNRSNEQRRDVLEEEFIPFACHYDPHTLLTKNGELLQTIKITGFSYESVNAAEEQEKKSLRQTIRDAVTASIDSPHFALWFHTVRRRKNLATGGAFAKGSFEEHAHNEWVKRHDWEHKYVNELYVTIIHEGQSFGLFSRGFTRSLFYRAERTHREKYLEKSHRKLEAVVTKMLEGLVSYGARRLGIFEKRGVSYSEPLQLFGKIINLEEVPRPVPISDLSEYLPTNDVAFGFNVLEVYAPNKRHFATIFSVKEYHEVSSAKIDEFLQIDQEFIITETFDFINNEKALKSFEHQKYISSLSGDDEFARISGLADIVKSNKGRPVDFGEHQITIMLIKDSMLELEKQVKETADAFARIGVAVVREDIMMEECFWSQLPGNFEFLRRLSPINTIRTAGFASLYNFPAGKIEGTHWGPAVTVFYTRAGTPYFYNFHAEDNGHTTIIGPFGAGKTVLLNFLLSEARKFNNRLFFFDQDRASEIFLRAIGGSYKRVLKNKEHSEIRFNPLLLQDSPANRSFLKAWFQYLIMDDNMQVSSEDKQITEKVIEHVYSLPLEQRTLSNIIPKFWPFSEAARQEESSANDTAKRLADWYGQGKYAHIFDNVRDEIVMDHMVYGFGLTEMVSENRPVVPLLSYLFHRIRMSLDGTPTILVLDEAWSLIDNPVFAPHIEGWLDDLRANNALAIFATESVSDAKNSSITDTITKKMATQIFLPNPDATEAYTEVFGLTEDEFELLNSMNAEKREFLLKHAGDAVVASLDLGGMHDIIAVLSGSKENVAIMEGVMMDVGEEPEKWLPIFKEKAVKQ